METESATVIFIRINSKGVVLSQADFAMSKIVANETYGLIDSVSIMQQKSLRPNRSHSWFASVREFRPHHLNTCHSLFKIMQTYPPSAWNQ